jgi:inosine-uridine nucleoside N-ribohydrolase
VAVRTLRSRSRLLLTLTASLLALTATPIAPAHAQVASRTLVVSTDLGIDDLVAIAWLVNDPALDIAAILVSGTGLAACPAAVDDARALLAALGAEGPEIGCGATTPLQGGGPFPEDRRAAAAGLYGLGLPPAADAGAPSRPAEEILGELLDQAFDPVTILSLAPMTSLGDVVTDPDRSVKIASITASIGALAGPGDVTPAGATTPGAAEQNAHADPQAAEYVLESGAPLTIVPLEVARSAPLSQTLVDALLAGGEVPSAAFVAQLAAAHPELLAADAILPDAIAAVSLTNPTLLETRERFLEVELQGDEGGALRETETGFPAQVAVAMDRAAFETALLEGVRAEGGTSPETPAGTVTIRGGSAACDLDTGGTTAPGLAIITAASSDAPLVAVLAGLAEGKGTADLESLLQTTSPTEEPPDWLLLAAYLEVEAGATVEDAAELTPGDYAAICITGDEAAPTYLVAPQLLTITE